MESEVGASLKDIARPGCLRKRKLNLKIYTAIEVSHIRKMPVLLFIYKSLLHSVLTNLCAVPRVTWQKINQPPSQKKIQTEPGHLGRCDMEQLGAS